MKPRKNPKKNNPVAKYAKQVNKAHVFVDRKKEEKKTGKILNKIEEKALLSDETGV